MAYQSPLPFTIHGALVAMLFSASQLYAASLPAAARGEIDSLLWRLAVSGCEFKRNGSWHTAEEAQAHLRRKLDYLEKKSAVASTDQFIQRAATKSSMSGKPYQVRCGNQARVPSSRWLRTELQKLRAGTKK